MEKQHDAAPAATETKGKLTGLFGSLSSAIRTIFDTAMDNVLILDQEGHILEANQKAITSYGYSREELLQLKILDIRHPSTWADYEGQMRASESSGVFFECIHCRKDGSNFPVEVSSRSITFDGTLLRVHIIRDISERKKAEDQIRHLANHDPLTGLPNRGNIERRLTDIWHESSAQHTAFAVMVIDLDKFKTINDTYGHQAGDAVLKEAAQRFTRALRRDDSIGRYGGDEFLLIQRGIKDESDITALIQRIFHEFEQPWHLDKLVLAVSLTIGVSLFPEDGSHPDELIQAADQAMYQAKKIEGFSYFFFSQTSG